MSRPADHGANVHAGRRVARLGTAIGASPNDDTAVAIVAGELNETLGRLAAADQRDALYRNVITRRAAHPA